MKKIIALGTLISSLGFIQHTMAENLNLKRSCLKENPIMEGVTDQTLVSIYSQVCDKKNKDNKNAYLVQAAQRFNALGLNYHAIQLISSLEAQNISSQGLTDTKFLVGSKLANDALVTMREKELRYLSEEVTYPAAKELTTTIQRSLPSSILVEQAPKVTRPVVTVPKVQYRPPVTQPKPKPPVTQSRTPKPPVTQSKTPKPAQTSAKPASPFSNL